MKKTKPLQHLTLLAMLIWMITPLLAQEEVKKEEDNNKPVRAPFESSWIIDNQTVVVPRKGTLEFVIQHRFGTVSSGLKDLYGLYLPSNIRLGFTYTLFDHFGFGSLSGPLSIGFGTTKNNRTLDVNVKYAILQQTRSGSIPVSVTYYGNTAAEVQQKLESLPNGNSSDRYSYFHQLIISRRFSSKFSLQVSPSLSHYNVVKPHMKNDHLAVALAGRWKISAQSAILVNVDQPITQHVTGNPQPNIGVGMEIATSAHAFQVFVSNYSSLVQQRNNVYNANDPYDKGFLIGFNITRLWSF